MTFNDIVDLAEKAGCDVSAMDGREYQTMWCDSSQLERFAASLIQAGAASRDAEIQRLQFALADSEALELGTAERCDQLRAHINMLRDAFQTFIDEHEECQDADEWMAELCSIEALHVAGEALDTTPEQSLAEYRNKVIEAFVNEFSRHVGGDGEFWLHELQDFAMKEQP